MASLPKKGVKGANLRKWLIDSINGLIDYLHSARVRPGDGIMVKETPSGTIISLAKKETPVVNNTTGGTTPAVSGMVYPDWSQQPSSGIYANSPFTLTNGDAWLYVTGVWESSSGTGLSEVYYIFSLNGHSNSYRIGAFRSTESGKTGYFSNFIPVKQGTTVELVASTSSVHTLMIVDSGVFVYQS